MKEIEIDLGINSTGLTTLYAIASISGSTVVVSNGSLVAYTPATYQECAIPMSDSQDGYGRYFGNFPAGAPTGLYSLAVWSTATGGAASATMSTDVIIGGGGPLFPWNAANSTSQITASTVNPGGGSGGTMIQSFDVSGSFNSTPSFSNSFVMSTSNRLLALSVTAPANGKVAWKLYGTTDSTSAFSLLLDGAKVPIQNNLPYPIPAGSTATYVGMIIPTLCYAYEFQISTSNATPGTVNLRGTI